MHSVGTSGGGGQGGLGRLSMTGETSRGQIARQEVGIRRPAGPASLQGTIQT